MHLRSLSASSASTFEACPARWKAQYVTKAPWVESSPAALGNVIHETLETWIDAKYHIQPPAGRPPLLTLLDFYTLYYEAHFEDRERFDEGWEMVERWYYRNTPWPQNRRVESTELRETFELTYFVTNKKGEKKKRKVDFTYIFDRLDIVELPNGEFEVIVTDYKTWVKAVSAEEMRNKIQVRAYGLAAQLKYPDAKHIRVVLDQLRYDPVGIILRKEDNREAWRYLARLASRIHMSDGSEERIGPECRWCIRLNRCKNLAKALPHATATTLPIETAIDLRRLAADKIKGIEAQVKALDEVILAEAEREEVFELETSETDVKITAKPRRKIDRALAAKVVGDAVMRQFPGGITIKAYESLVDPSCMMITEDQKRELKSLIQKEYGDPYVVTTQKGPFNV